MKTLEDLEIEYADYVIEQQLKPGAVPVDPFAVWLIERIPELIDDDLSSSVD
ncbi:hypothetical protein [Leptothrix discophora]|uniref:Uncharacterized protein n=1 Tax=Leptothrix discophora TaxID=89 RepID=A0ABT9G0D1_LEPDI|nr:hypothetical protein [Leptothrix discophora]MDP4299945.1 hypothetical protein [Leptothrix discophora]